MTKEQIKWFEAQLSEIKRQKHNVVRNLTIKESAELKKARRIISAHQKKVDALKKRANASFTRASDNAREAILFGDEKKIRKALADFSNRKI
jgi:tRNA(Leu) C34 or U34 (ribose-2'-O)-methylase TrmL